ELLREHAVAAAEVEDALARTRPEQLDHRRTEIRYEACVARVALRVPGLRRGHDPLRYHHAPRRNKRSRAVTNARSWDALAPTPSRRGRWPRPSRGCPRPWPRTAPSRRARRSPTT